MRTSSASKESIKRQKIDRQRCLRVAKYIDYPFILPDSPVELDEGYIVADKDTGDVFASFVFKHLAENPLKKLNIRLACYLNQNIPYLNIDFTYSQDDLTFGLIKKNGVELKLREANKRSCIQTSETFGSCVFIPLPESYFTKMDVILISVEYDDGSVEELNTLVAGNNKKYKDLDNYSKLAYSRVNIYYSAEEKFPTTVIPQFGSKVWLCCCGNKNPVSSDKCEKCGREKDWQQKTATDEAITETKNKLVADPTENVFHDKSRFAQNKYLESDEETQSKIEQYERAMKNVAEAERRKQRRQLMLIPKILLFIAVVYLITFALRVLISFQTPSKGDSGGAEAAIISVYDNL